MDHPLSSVSGTVDSITYRNEETCFTVLELADQSGRLVTVVGEMPQIAEGERLVATGRWTNHPNFGLQLKAESITHDFPEDERYILKYLSSGIIKGIGPINAARIVENFGGETFDILEKEPLRLAEIKGISRSKAAEIAKELQQIFSLRGCMAFYSQHEIQPAESLKIWKKWGPYSVDLIKANPFLLCEDPILMDFERVDEIARSFQMERDDLFRIRAGIRHILTHNLSLGHTCLPQQKISGLACAFLEVEAEKVDHAIEQMIENAELNVQYFDNRRFLYLPAIYQAETGCAKILESMLELSQTSISELEKKIDRIEQSIDINYDALQRNALRMAAKNSIMVLTGGPGTGKTTVLNGIYRLFESEGLKVCLTAPTGRAAKRMSEVIGQEGKTIHRLLEVAFSDQQTAAFARNESNPLPYDAVIVDELSMVDIQLFYSLLKAVKLGSKLILVGDYHQLPSVGAGNVLKDLLDAGIIPNVQLNHVFRQAAASLIVTNAHKIVKGEYPELESRDNDFFFIPCTSNSEIIQLIVELYSSRLPAKYGYSPQRQIQVLSPGRKGDLGCEQLNRFLQPAVNSRTREKNELTFGSIVLREGDKVLQGKNDYDIIWQKADGESGTGVFNGDIGFIESIERAKGVIKIHFEDRVAEYGMENLSELELAYATTVHKSQGNEFEAVILPVFSGAPQLFYRNLLYTAVTRAKKLLIIVGSKNRLYQMIDNDRKTLRYTGLKQLISGDF